MVYKLLWNSNYWFKLQTQSNSKLSAHIQRHLTSHTSNRISVQMRPNLQLNTLCSAKVFWERSLFPYSGHSWPWQPTWRSQARCCHIAWNENACDKRFRCLSCWIYSKIYTESLRHWMAWNGSSYGRWSAPKVRSTSHMLLDFWRNILYSP